MNQIKPLSSRPRLLHMAGKQLNERVWSPRFREALEGIGELTLITDADLFDDEAVVMHAKAHDILITNWGSRRLPEALAHAPGRLRYICNVSGEIRPYVPRTFIERGITVSNWGPLPAFGVAEGALALLMTVLKQIIPHRIAIQSGQWNADCLSWQGSIRDLRVGIYGLGAIGKMFAQMITPLQPLMAGFDPYCGDWPASVDRRATLDDLFEWADAVIITAALTDQTRRSVGAEQLSRMRDSSIIINVARGAIIDQGALFAELQSGRLRAGLDVLDDDGKDWVDPAHPARHWPNLILSAHRIGGASWTERLSQQDRLSRLQQIAFDNLQNFVLGNPVQFAFDLTRYDRST